MIHRAVRDWRLSLLCALVAMGQAASGVADACSLDTLLRLPLEQLLELKIGPSSCSPGPSTSPALQPRIAPGSRP
ncbi:hypothetical protein [uncultured Azohydromonas sp.]|jgi:hypothetical protein|uniref:hypothetical protein n=1 Tax=uncultured Azohydromonas sp. TaxID=487342 RepID=UPI002621BC56|nr:hypothetical protein [uncultured Azohydromonas sp.]